MQRVSVKTLVLLLLLLAVVIAHQHIACVPSARAGVLWLEDDPNDPGDPGPEYGLGGARWVWLEVTPTDPNDPNEPLPESVGWMPTFWLVSDDPNDPGPECV
ncbi:MAG: hypothetical protein JW993_01050 [Sedimentisphaerales bacterium]|nr:hypothetical protein [Sedimentisphaerales bacterium]